MTAPEPWIEGTAVRAEKNVRFPHTLEERTAGDGLIVRVSDYNERAPKQGCQEVHSVV